MSLVERELKLVPVDADLMDRLAGVRALGEFTVTRVTREVQLNSFFDTPSRALSRARLGFRRRTVEGQTLAWWTIKADTALVRGVATRAEVELRLSADMPPALALGALRQAAQQRGARALAESVGDALSGCGLPLATPFLESSTDRTILDLVAENDAWSVELAIDRVSLVGHDYAELEIEAELKRGPESCLAVVRAAVEAVGQVRESCGSKLSRALAHVEECSCVREGGR